MTLSESTEILSSTLYIVPTPIGNLRDITQRALDVLQAVDIIAAEDTRRTGLLLQHFGITNKLLPFYDHNEDHAVTQVMKKLTEGTSIALVSDAGTPLINDPGYTLVHQCHKQGIRVIPLPGACAAITALSAAGLPTDRFCYEGFLPPKKKARSDLLMQLSQETRTMIFYESTHRILESLADIISEFGADRYIVLARELTKTWENIYGASAIELLAWLKIDENRYKGEIVLIIAGYKEKSNHVISIEAIKTLMLLQQELPLNKAAALAAKIHNVKKNELYRYAIEQSSK